MLKIVHMKVMVKKWNWLWMRGNPCSIPCASVWGLHR